MQKQLHFCFVAQLPKGMRRTLYVKDDDWRLSFVSGTYVTLTNLAEGELERIKEKNSARFMFPFMLPTTMSDV